MGGRSIALTIFNARRCDMLFRIDATFVADEPRECMIMLIKLIDSKGSTGQPGGHREAKRFHVSSTRFELKAYKGANSMQLQHLHSHFKGHRHQIIRLGILQQSHFSRTESVSTLHEVARGLC